MNPDPLQNEDLVLMWLEVNIKPLIKSISKHFLSCLSTKSFSCSTYQTVYVRLGLAAAATMADSHRPVCCFRVKELSNYYSEMDPVRQRWTYAFFMYPFLSGDRVAGKYVEHMNEILHYLYELMLRVDFQENAVTC